MDLSDELIRTWATPVDGGPCPYLPDRQFGALILPSAPLGPVGYRMLLDQRFRRLGDIMYQPDCTGCKACMPIRIPVAAFSERRDQRRCRSRNTDLSIAVTGPDLDDEGQELYRRYQEHVHDDTDGDGSNLWQTGGMDVIQLQARDTSGQLLGISLCDRFADGLSSIYCIYDPDQPRRSLGTWMALAEIDYCRNHGLDWLYLGFYVPGCRKMIYKARFRPYEILTDGQWVRHQSLPE